MTPITPYAIRAEFDRRLKERMANVSYADILAALQVMPHREYLAQLAREHDWTSVGRAMEIALRQMWSTEINREVEEWADEQANGPLVSKMQITEKVSVPGRL